MKNVLIVIVFSCTLCSCGNKKKEIVDQQFRYRDSLALAKSQLMLSDTIQNGSLRLNTRVPILKRIMTYEWKLDSLDMRLKSY